MAEELNLSTTRERQKLTIDGKSFEILSLEEVPFAFGLAIEDLHKKLSAAGEGKLSDEEISRLITLVRANVRAVVVGLGDLEAKLTDMQCLKVLTRFCTAPEKPAPAGSMPAPAKEPISC